MRVRPLRLAALSLACSALACAHGLAVSVPKRSTSGFTPPIEFQAGASRVDLTPIPGIPLGGYSTEAKVSRGFWTRLYARSIVLEDTSGQVLALVTTDLMVMPAGLADRVVELLHAPPPDGVPRIGRENLLIAATETHQSPGNFFDSKLYNAYSSPQVGFDEELFEFLARQISKGIREAYANRRPALLEASHFSGPKSGAFAIDDFVRNRSMDAFLLNPEAHDIIASNSGLTPCPVGDADWPHDYPDPRACQAVQARVDLLEFLDPKTRAPIALAVFVPAHITVLDAQSEVYSGDVFGLAAIALESRIGKPLCVSPTQSPVPTTPAPPAPIVGIFNGAQGDISLQWRRRDREQALALSSLLVRHVCDRIAAGLRSPGLPTTLGFQFGYFSVADQPVDCVSCYPHRTAAEPATGSAELGGAEDQRTLFYDLGQREGRRHYARRAHGILHPPLAGEFLGISYDFVGEEFRSNRPPHEAPLGVYRIGDVAIVGFPSEPTTAMGLRIRRGVATAMGYATPDQVLLVSFANGHISYVTTPQEYDRQTYEGASNYWGAATGPFLKDKAQELSGKLAAKDLPADPSGTRYYETGKIFRFEPRNAWGPVYDPDEGLANIATRGGDPYRKFPAFCWRDAIPSLASSGSTTCARVVPDVSVQDASTGMTVELHGLAQNNEGYGIVTAMVGVSEDETEWCAVWLRDDASPVMPSTCRFDVKRIDGGLESSADFACKGPGPDSRPRDTSGYLEPLVPNDGSSAWCRSPLDLLGWCSTTCAAGAL